MPKKTAKDTRQQIGVRLSEDAVTNLAKLQQAYAKRAGLILQLSQSEAVEIALREAIETLKVR